jgi:hypothetical protein
VRDRALERRAVSDKMQRYLVLHRIDHWMFFKFLLPKHSVFIGDRVVL